MGFFVFCLLCLCARLFICALWSPAGKGLTSWLSFVVSNYEFVTFPLVSWVSCGTSLYRFLIFVPLHTLLCTQCSICQYECVDFHCVCYFSDIECACTLTTLKVVLLCTK